MNKSLLTVVIPSYNCEKYISRCLDSIINQSFKAIDVVIVDDASTDSSLEIIKSYSLKHPNIKHIELKENHGVCFSRNTGLDTVRTEYVTFMDDDDYIDVLTYQKCISGFDESTDIVSYGLCHDYMNVNAIEKRYVYPQNFSISGQYALKNYGHTIHDEFAITPIVNNKIYRTSMLNQNSIRFDESVCYQEDDIFTFEALSCARKVTFVSNCYYHYCQNAGSALRQVSEKSISHFVAAYKSLFNYLNDKSLFEQLKDEYYFKFKSSLIGVVRRTIKYSPTPKRTNYLLSLLYKLLLENFDIAELIGYCNLAKI